MPISPTFYVSHISMPVSRFDAVSGNFTQFTNLQTGHVDNDTTGHYKLRPRAAELSIDECVSRSVCLSVRRHIYVISRPIFSKCFVHITHGGGLVFIWRRCDVYCISGLWITSYLHILARNMRHEEYDCAFF